MLRPIFIFIAPALLFMVQILAVVATKKVTLRTGGVVLRQLGPSAPGSQVARRAITAVHTDNSSGSSTHLSDEANKRQLFLISFHNDSHAAALSAALKAQGADALSYIPENSLLVAASLTAVVNVSEHLGAEAALVGAEHKISPDFWQLIDANANPSNSSSNSNVSAEAGGGDQHQNLQWIQTSLAEDRISKFLSQLRTFIADGSSATAVPRYGIAVEVIPGLSASQLQAIGNDWETSLVSALNKSSGDSGSGRLGGACAPVVDAKAVVANVSVIIQVYLCKEDIVDGVRWFAQQDSVRWIAPMFTAKTSDVQANILLQRGELSYDQFMNMWAQDPAVKWPYWAAGLQGEGEIIGLADTGVDLQHCAFSDSRYNGSYQAALANASAPVLGISTYARIPGHRKVAQYAKMGIAGDVNDFQGHGTLVAGCIAAASLSDSLDPANSPLEPSDANGAAPRARLSVVDAQGGDGGSGSLLWIPYDAYGLYLPLHRAVGAYITSDSWSSAFKTGYEQQSKGFDRFLWENPEFVSVVSAGNDGIDILERYTIGSPGVAKNVITVGAGYSLPLDFASRSQFNIRGIGKDGSRLDIPIYPIESFNVPTLNTVVPDTEAGLRLVVAYPVFACTELRNQASDLRGAIILAVVGDCGVIQQALYADAAGAAGLIVVADTTVGLRAPSLLDPNTSRPVVRTMAVSTISKDIGLTLIGYIYSGGQLTLTRTVVPLDSNSVAEYSAWGPTPDGRIKPDIIAPGVYITSTDTTARNPWDSCNARTFDGTSASTPLVAGHVALMRQYLREGFYPTGSRSEPESAPFTPSGILLKAIIIAGAQSMEGGWAFNAGARLGPSPDGYQGWGRFSLAGSLPLRGLTDPRVRLQILDRGAFMAPGQSVFIGGITATGTGPVTVVLVYYDYPGDPNALTVMVNDLDLELWVNDRMYLGNNPENAIDLVPDTANTVERVSLSSLPEGAQLRVKVTAVFLPSLAVAPNIPQRWAVAVVGHFRGTLQSALNPAYLRLAYIPPSPRPPSPSPPRPPKTAKLPSKKPRPPPLSKAPLRKKSPPPPPKLVGRL